MENTNHIVQLSKNNSADLQQIKHDSLSWVHTPDGKSSRLVVQKTQKRWAMQSVNFWQQLLSRCKKLKKKITQKSVIVYFSHPVTKMEL